MIMKGAHFHMSDIPKVKISLHKRMTGAKTLGLQNSPEIDLFEYSNPRQGYSGQLS